MCLLKLWLDKPTDGFDRISKRSFSGQSPKERKKKNYSLNILALSLHIGSNSIQNFEISCGTFWNKKYLVGEAQLEKNTPKNCVIVWKTQKYV